MKKPTAEPKQSETGKATEKPARKTGRKPVTAKERKTPAGQGAASLRDAVNTAVDQRAKAIAKVLVDKTCDGNANLAGIVLKLAGADKAPPEPKRKKRKTKTTRFIERLVAEPEWEGPWDDLGGRRDASRLPRNDSDLPGDLR